MAYFARNPEGYKKLISYQNASTICQKIHNLTSRFNHIKYRRLIEHMRDSGRSIQRNIEEGFKRETTKEYITFLGYSAGSLEELKGDIDDCYYLHRLISKDEWDDAKTLLCRTDCLLGRQIRSLERKMDEENTRPQNERLRNVWKEENNRKEKFWKKVEEMGLVRLPDGRFVKKETIREDRGR